MWGWVGPCGRQVGHQKTHTKEIFTMTRKKEANILVSQQDETQAKQQLEHYHHIADDLHASENRQQAAAALSEINSMSEATQMALLKLLSKEHNQQAADVLIAIYELSPNKNVRKEARRSLIRLEEAKIHPNWTPPAETPLISQPIVNPPRFWKGLVTQNRESGEVELVLSFEQGIDYNEVRIFVFLLDFWQDGLSEFFTRTGTKRRMENEITTRFSKAKDLQLTDCTLAEGRRLLEEALSVNKWRGTTPNEDYRHEQPIVNQLIWRATGIGEDRGRTFITPDLDPEQVAANFVGGWSLGDFGLAYDLLTRDSNIREGLTRDEWIERRRAWANEAHPARWSLGFIYEREPQQKSLWLPAPMMGGYTSSRKEVEVGWSLELATTPLSGTLREMPMGTVVNKPTDRHWFWTSYSVVQESGMWRIQSMNDEGANAQAFSITELQKQINDLREEVKNLNEEYRPILQNVAVDETNEDVLDYMREVIWRMTKAMHYSDALISKLPLDRSVYEEAASEAQGAQAIERATVYLDRLAQRFPEFRGGTLRGLASMYASLRNTAERNKDTERSKLFSQQAEQAARDAVAADHAPLSYILLAELLIEQGSQASLDAAESLLHEAETRDPNREEQTLIELGLGNITIDRDQVEDGLKHFQSAADISPDYPGIWYTIGHVQSELKQYPEAEQSLKRALEANKDLQVYTELASVYMSQHKDAEARETIEQGLRLYPQSAILRALLAPLLLDIGDRRRAQTMIDEAERLNPDLEMVKAVRQIMNKHKKK
jgi:tetratricopeptide (TPR) repeat protein